MVCDFCREHGIDVIVRGVRDEKDMAFEHLSAEYNYTHSGVKTLLLAASDAFRGIIQKLAGVALSLGVVTPDATQGTALQEDRGSHSRPVVHAKALQLRDP